MTCHYLQSLLPSYNTYPLKEKVGGNEDMTRRRQEERKGERILSERTRQVPSFLDPFNKVRALGFYVE